MRELLTQIAEKGFAPIDNFMDPEAAVIGEYNVGGLVHSSDIIGLPHHVNEGRGSTQGLIPYKHSIRLIIAKVLHMNPGDWKADIVDSTRAVDNLKMHREIDEKLKKLMPVIEGIETDIKASSDIEVRMQLRDKEIQLWERKFQLDEEQRQLKKEKEQLKEIEVLLRHRQHRSIS